MAASRVAPAPAAQNGQAQQAGPPAPVTQPAPQDDHRPLAELRTSAATRAIMTTLEGGVVPRYYNDQAGNCTYGAGLLEHYGRCTPAEMARRPSQAEMAAGFNQEVARAEVRVRRNVNRPLTQGQFDALVSLAFNAGDFAGPMFHAVNVLGPEQAAGRLPTTAITVAVRDQHNRVIGHRVSRGLIYQRHAQ